MYTHDDILTPLALTVIIDHKVREPEMTEFYRQASCLNWSQCLSLSFIAGMKDNMMN